MRAYLRTEDSARQDIAAATLRSSWPESAWWLRCQWLTHRHDATILHPLLLRLQETRGAGFTTVARVVEVLESRYPKALVQSWIARTPGGRIGLPTRVCAWQDGSEPCREPVRAVNARYCETHAAASRRRSTRNAVRLLRGKQSGPRATLDLQGLPGRDTLHPGIRPRR